MLDSQIQILSVDTGNFYSGNELRLHKKNHKLRLERKNLVQEMKSIESNLKKLEINKNDIETISSFKSADSAELCEQFGRIDENVYDQCLRYAELKRIKGIKNASIKKSKEDLLTLLSNKVQANLDTSGKDHIRELNLDSILDSDGNIQSKNIISVFESSFTRTIGAKPDVLCEDFMVIQVYYFSIIKDLICFGFLYKGEKYKYFTSSAGQIRTKKAVFVKESVWNKYEKTIMCGLTVDDINKNGGNNPNKFLAYIALSSSATDAWNEFDVEKTIVIDDFETDVYGEYDFVDDSDYSITRRNGYIPIPHTDGCGMILPNAFGAKQKNMMIRLPWVKGLISPFDYVKFIQVNNCSPIIKDIYGIEHDVIAEDIQVIFTKSQFKMHSHYKSWAHYKECYKKYHCSAGIANIESDRIKDARINYQMLQTLTDITDEEIKAITKSSIDRLNNLCSSVESIKSALGITPYNTDMTPLQKSIALYPNLINDEFIKSNLRDIKNSMVKKYKSGKLEVFGKYTFILPDLYAACQYWFQRIEQPEGLLENGEVFCWLFRKSEKLDCLRSPHLFIEHPIRINTACNHSEKQLKNREWFITNALYTSSHDLITKIIQCDTDGDMALVVSDKTLIKVAERNIKKYDIVPLYYDMKKAKPVLLDNVAIYDGLNAAFTGSNIGQYSNNISKIWNSNVFISGTDDEKNNSINTVKLLCMENNYIIDKAKTLYMPERPYFAKELITKHTKEKLPHFFKYAKDKSDDQVSDINDSLVNKLDSIIPNPRINCRSIHIGKINWHLMMSNSNIDIRVVIMQDGSLNRQETDPLILKYHDLSKKYRYKINMSSADSIPYAALTKSQLRQNTILREISIEIKEELSKFGYSDVEITDILVGYLYGIRTTSNKEVLWFCYGGIIYDNLLSHKSEIANEISTYGLYHTKSIQCEDCGEWFYINTKDNTTRKCQSCYSRYRKVYKAKVERERRENFKRGQGKIFLDNA